MALPLAKRDLELGRRLGVLAGKPGALQRLGVPTIADEAWRYTNLRGVLAQDFALPEKAPAAKVPAPLVDGAVQLVFVEGRLRQDLCVGALEDAGFELRAPSPRLESARGFFALNQDFASEGLALFLPKGKKATRPLELLFLDGASQAASLSAARVALDLAEGASAEVIERHLSLKDHSGVSDLSLAVSLARGASLHHLRLQETSPAATNLGLTLVALAGDASYRAEALILGAGLFRHELEVALTAPGATAQLSGAVLLKGLQHGDVTTRIFHQAPDTRATENLRFALDEASHGVFQGLITVEEGAARADGRLNARTLLLSDKAAIDAKPELRIFHDNVACAHGATVGKLDPQQLFYLRCRGLDEKAARRLLVHAFLAEMLGEEQALIDQLDKALAQ